MEETQEQSQLHFLDYWRVIRSRKEIILAVVLLVVLTGSAVTFMLPRIYMAEARIKIEQDNLDIDVFQQQMAMGYNPFFLRTQYEIIQSKPILYEVIRNLDLRSVWGREQDEAGAPWTRERAYGELRHSLQVEQYRDTSLVALQVYREDNAEAARIANELAHVYRNYRLSVKRREIKSAVDVLKNELEKQKEIVDEAEAQLEHIREKLGVNFVGRGIRADDLRLRQLEADRIAARVDMLVRKARLEQLSSLNSDELMTASTFVVNDPAIINIRRQLLDIDVNLKLKLENFGENHPEVKRLVAGQKELKKQREMALAGLIKGLEADYEISLQKYKALSDELDSARSSDIDASRTKFLPFEKAERELQIQYSILNALRSRVAQEGIELEIPRTPVRIIDPAEAPRRPVSPNLYLNILLSIIVGVAAGVGIAYFLEYLDTSMKTVDDVERYLQMPVLGIIPQKVLPLNEESPESSHAEPYRVLLTNLQYANREVGGGAFSVLSGGMGEGKSTTLFNLAYVASQSNKKVLIVDSDMRRPVQHTMLGMSNRVGLSNVLMRDVPVDEVIKSTDIPNLHLLPSGKLPKSSFGLLDSQRMRDLMRDLKVRYDYVFFDSPPVMGLSDASILASEVDGALLVVQYRKYPRDVSLRAKKIIENVGGHLFGVVLNNINVMRDDYYYHYHTYYAHYYSDEERAPTPPAVLDEEMPEDKF